MKRKGSVPTRPLLAVDIDQIAEARFWALVAIDFRPGACWHWRGAVENGYGRFKLNGGRSAANRVSFALFNGEAPSGKFICHRCDNPICVRPDHLFLGTPTDNMMDKVNKRRHAFGSRTGTAILNERSVREIRELLSDGQSLQSIAVRFGVAKRTVQKIKNGENWSHLL